MKKYFVYLLALFVACIFLFVVTQRKLRAQTVAIDEYNSADRTPGIYPDYTETVIPPNIAPLNFIVQELSLIHI